MNIFKRIKTYEMFNENKKNIIDNIDNKEFIEDLYYANPLYKTHDFFVFIYTYDFKKLNNNNYKRVLDIENMHKVTPDNYIDVMGMNIRARVEKKKIGTIWWPKELSDLINGKSSNDMDLYIIDMIEKYMIIKNDAISKEIFKKIYDKKLKKSKNIEKQNRYNL